MPLFRVLLVDDDADIREVVELALSLDPAFIVRSCASGADAMRVVADWTPDIILLDAVMPGMDGPTALARLRQRPQTAKLPVVFLTARVQSAELEELRALGPAGVIAKPFDPMTLAALVRCYAAAAEPRIEGLRKTFLVQVRAKAEALARLRPALNEEGGRNDAWEQAEAIAHDLAELAAIYGFHRISIDADILHDTLLAGTAGKRGILPALQRLLAGIDHEFAEAGNAHGADQHTPVSAGLNDDTPQKLSRELSYSHM
jgi:CheY-like chemotaxis protein